MSAVNQSGLADKAPHPSTGSDASPVPQLSAKYRMKRYSFKINEPTTAVVWRKAEHKNPGH